MMQITSIEIHHYRLPLDPPFYAAWDPRPRSSHTATIVRVRAGDYEGVGSGDAMLGFAGHEYLFVGHDPFDIERHVHILDNLQFMYGRMWPLEVALWDLMGKISGQPLWKLMGGRSNQVRLYASCGERRPAAERAESARRLRDQGYPALKIRFHAADGGEGNREVAELREYLKHGSLDVYQPDVVWSTGLLRGRQIAGEVQAAGAIYSPHTWGDGLVVLANLHVSAAISTAPFIEFPYDPPGWTLERRDYILPTPTRPDAAGTVTLPDAPGLGVTIDWDALEPLRIRTGTMA